MTETLEQLRLQLEQARQALQASEARFRNIIERNANGIIIVDRQDKVHFVNATAETLLARQAEELLGERFGFPLEAGETTELDIVGEDGQKTVTEMRVVESKWDGEPVYLVSLHDITERVRMETALQESEKEYRQLLETLQEGIWAIDKDAYTTFVNPRMAEMLDYSVEEMQGKHLFSFMDERGVEICQRNLERRQQGIREQHEFELLRKDGSRIYTLMETSPMTDDAGNYIGAIAGVIDITTHKRADEALLDVLEKARQREREVSALLEGSRAVLKYQDFEPAARAIFYACKDLIGATCGYVALLTEDGRENEVLFVDSGELPCNVDPNLPMPIRGLREAVCRTGQAISHNNFPHSQWVELIPEGHVGLDNVLFTPLVIEGKAVGLLGLANKPGGFTENDVRMASAFSELAAITLHNSRTLELLENSEERFRSVMQTASDAITVIDSRGHIIFWNQAAENIFGYSTDKALGKPLTFVIPERFREAHRMGLQRVGSTGKTKFIGETVELVGLRKDGNEFPLELSLATWQTGEEIFFTGIVRDITERKQTEEQIRTALAEKEVLLQEIHHRVKNNLTVISCILDLQGGLIEDGQAQVAFRESQNRIVSMARVHEHLYRSEDLTRIDMVEYIQKLVDHLQSFFGPYAATITVNAADIALDIQEAIPCGLIINELVTNALKYAFPTSPPSAPPGEKEEKGENEIRVELYAEDEEQLVLVVSDNGVGIPPGLDWYDTSSLGLELVRILTQQLQGKVEVDTSTGTAFKVTFARPKVSKKPG